MVVLRTIFRLTLFIIAIAAIVVTLGAGYWAFSSQTEAAAASISLGDPSSVGRSPQNIEDFLLGFYLQTRADAITRPVSDDPTPVPFTVEVGETAVSIAARLEELGLISDAGLFRLFLRYNGLDASLEAGDYELRRNMNMREIAEALQKANFEEVTVTIPEGWRAEEIAELLTRENIMDGTEFLAFVRQGQGINHPLLADRPPGASYEGYLFPDTYRLPVNASPEDLVTRMVENMAAKLPANTMELAAAQGYSFFEILTIASIVEREAVLPEERPLIASVYLNRLAQGMPLQADPTVQYAMGYQTDTGQWWKTPVTLEEYSQVDSPYNTYLNYGLPPGPISNPGADSIIATLQPAQTNYLFFMGCGGEGAHLFAEDFETHEQNVAACSGGQ
ncbi:MAG: endolytic transglycosylase MltG [Chloroflexi bacterium]|nr:MAG: endolytic transglycosylase MltG [Chloroflexota bacterium]